MGSWEELKWQIGTSPHSRGVADDPEAVATVMMAALVALMGLNVVNTGVGDTGRITENGICDK